MKSDAAYLLLGGIFGLTILAGSMRSGETVLILAALVVALAAMAISMRSPYRGFYTLCFGEASVLSVLPASLAAGIIAQLVLIALCLHSTGVLQERTEIIAFFAYSVCTAGLAVILAGSSTIGLLFVPLILLTGTAVLMLCLWEYRLRVRVTEAAR